MQKIYDVSIGYYGRNVICPVISLDYLICVLLRTVPQFTKQQMFCSTLYRHTRLLLNPTPLKEYRSRIETSYSLKTIEVQFHSLKKHSSMERL